jgi:hypothetical protein
MRNLSDSQSIGGKDGGMEGISPYREMRGEHDHGLHRGSNHRPHTESGRDLRNEKVRGAAASATAQVSQQSLNVTIVTAEGDRVTISSNASVTNAVATYQQKTAGSSTQACATATASSYSLSLAIEGSLNQDELKDIAKALQSYTKVLNDSLSGNAQPVQPHAGQIENLDQIASFDATFSAQQAFSAQVAIVAQS